MAVSVPNQWALTFNQPAAFQTTPPALQSVVVALTSANSVGGGSGTPTAGNWLFVLAGMNEQATASGFTVAVSDDIHSFWRPGDTTASTWAVSTGAALTRTAAWYTPNTARVVNNVYVAPSGAFDALSVLVVEVAGLGVWDTVTGINTNYAAAATTLNLALGAPSGNAFLLAAVTGDNTANGQAFAPASWTTLHTVSATNGVDHTCDAVLTSAWITTSGSVSVNGTASPGVDLSGAVIGVLAAAASPIPAAQNPNWPYVKFEAAFGGGFQTPPDQLTWTDLTARLWSWDETTGAQYQLGQIQATDLNLEIDNNDAMLSPDNPAAYFYTAAGVNWAPQAAFYDTAVSGGTPLAWWKLNDAAGAGSAADSSGNSRTATATSVTFGNASQAVTGNNSASFASGSTSHCLSAYNPALSAVTVEAWVNLNGNSQSGNPNLLANSSTGSDHKGFELMLSGTTPQVVFGNTSTSATVTAASALPASGWTYLAGTWDGTTVTLYVNGVSAGTAALSGTMPAGSNNIGIGYNPTAGAAYMNGLLAECAIYGTALTAGQVSSHFTSGPAVTGTPLRIRAALGTLGGVTSSRWYVISRNAEQWPQEITGEDRRRFIPATATDIWSTMSASGPTPYRGEVQQGNPYAWWPLDDQPLSGGVLPTTMRNAASGNTNTLSVILSPNGAVAQVPYDTNGASLSGDTTNLSAIYTVGADQGWMPGDPQSSPSSYSTGNPVTTTPGSAAWQTSQQQGNTGSYGWFLSVNDTGFPVLANGITVEGWFNYLFFGSGKSVTGANTSTCQQPYSPLTLLTLATGALPVAILQLSTAGHLSLITYNGSTPTTHSVYTTSDLRSESWFHVAVTMTTSAWTVYVNGGVTATVSGSGAGMTSAWTWLLVNGDTGVHGGGNTATIVHSGNVSASHIAVYPAQLPLWQILAHYCAATTGFGLIPAPTGTAITWSLNDAGSSGATYAPDGSLSSGSGGYAVNASSLSVSAVVSAVIGSYNSGPSAWVSASCFDNISQDFILWVNWNGLAAKFGLYTNANVSAETNAATVAGSGDSFSSGFGAGAVGHGFCQTASGSGASPPASASSLGDTVQQRIERILGYGAVTSPARAIDPAALLVQAAADIGGQQVASNAANISGSDGGLLFIDNLGTLTYWQRTHLSSQYGSPVWAIGPANTPYYKEFAFPADPQRVWNAITVTPFSPDGASLASLTPSQPAQVTASQAQYGAQPKQVQSYLQSATEQQNQADWLFATYGTLHVRAENVKIDAAPNPAEWQLVMGVNSGDVATVQNWQIGGGALVGTYRVSRIRRHLEFSGPAGSTAGSVELTLDWEPPSYWS